MVMRGKPAEKNYLDNIHVKENCVFVVLLQKKFEDDYFDRNKNMQIY